ncbi:Sulfotransferase domain-containing protein [Limimonas halophila]|uniref:Sulfotransferase domain-containing protein n=1 Tax=Limimonas halophila TaxID=1082479 RepID=A0A1G7SNJ1_9PROT|nr:sulfotransferase domain-containing protein [Limimonas halophila]SDG24538.1 Sulfotransferase domain-containing protein [Limimonas halophila]
MSKAHRASVTRDQHPEETLRQGVRAHDQGDRGEARRLYERVLTAIPRHPVALQMLASVEYLEGNVTHADVYRDKAIESFGEAVAANPGVLPPLTGYVNLLLAAGRVHEAEHQASALRLGLNPFRHDATEFNRRRRAAYEAGHPPVLINTIPKSASESIWNRLADSLDMAQCQVSIGLFPNCMAVPLRVAELGAGGIASKEHLAPTAFNVKTLAESGVERLVVHLRDPRQVALSWAHFVRDHIATMPTGPLWRDTCPPLPVLHGSFEALMDWAVDSYIPLVVDFIQGWQQIAEDDSSGLSVLFTTFEDFKADPDTYMQRVLSFYGADAGADAANVASEDGHLRQGRTDEWREVLTQAQQERARRVIGDAILDRFGWPR